MNKIEATIHALKTYRAMREYGGGHWVSCLAVLNSLALSELDELKQKIVATPLEGTGGPTIDLNNRGIEA